MSSETQLAVLPPVALARNISAPLWNALIEIYDGASPDKIALVHDYCVARSLDPLKKPVHIVSVWSARRRMMVETIWPSVAETRITAMRTRVFAGQDEAKWGPTITQKVGNMADFSYPEWCQITLYRMVEGQKCAFPGPRVYWLEAYASQKKDDPTPNSMWAKRTWGQLEKCAEAASLRRAFPEEAGGIVSHEEAQRHHDLDEDGLKRVSPEPGTGETGGEAGATPKRAAVPGKRAKGATAMAGSTANPPAGDPPPTEPVIEVSSEVIPPAPGGTESAGVSSPSAPAAETPPAPAEAPSPAAVGEWPKTIIARVAKSVPAKTKATDTEPSRPVQVVELSGGTVMIGGVQTDVSKIGRLVMDPSRPELNKFAVVSDENVEFTVVQEQSTSDPTKTNLIITKAMLADVAM